MATPPSRNWFRPNSTYMKSNTTITFSSGSEHTNNITCTNGNAVNAIAIKVGTGTSVTVGTTTVVTYNSNSDNVSCTFTKSSTQDYKYIFFQFLQGSTSRGYIRMYIGSFGTGKYRISFGKVQPTSKKITNIMITSGSETYDWDAMQAPIAYSGDYSVGAGDTFKSAILYNATNKDGRALIGIDSRTYTIVCPLWSGLTSTYVDRQAVRWCDIDEYNVTRI